MLRLKQEMHGFQIILESEKKKCGLLSSDGQMCLYGPVFFCLGSPAGVISSVIMPRGGARFEFLQCLHLLAPPVGLKNYEEALADVEAVLGDHSPGVDAAKWHKACSGRGSSAMNVSSVSVPLSRDLDIIEPLI